MGYKESLIERYREFLPVTSKTPIITMGEGDTPLVRSRYVKDFEVYFKLEGLNPTGSFKDRGMTVAVSKAVEEGSRAIICASTGNTSASASAYGARAGLKVFVVVPSGYVAKGKLAQAFVYGAEVIAIDGNFDRALEIVRKISSEYPVTLVNSINPYRIEGQKTASFEIVDELGDAPDFLFIPVGNAGNITAYWKGFKEYKEAGRAKKLPRMMGFEAEGAAPIYYGRVIEEPKTIATAIRIGNPASWDKAVRARDESGGVIDIVSDEEIMDAYITLAREEGIFCEPASAASFAGLVKYMKKGLDFSGKRVVCVITGTGLKDPDTAMEVEGRIYEVKATEVEKFIGGFLGQG